MAKPHGLSIKKIRIAKQEYIYMVFRGFWVQGAACHDAEKCFCLFYTFFSSNFSCDEFDKLRIDTHIFKLRSTPVARFFVSCPE